LRKKATRLIILLSVAAFGGLGFWAYASIRKIMPAKAPERVQAIIIPADVNKIGTAILEAYAGEMVPSGEKEPVIADVSPREGPPGTLVTVTGNGFGAKQGLNAVSINLTEAQPLVEVLEWSDTKIRFLVPIHCTSGDVNVVLWDYLRSEMAPNGSFRAVTRNPRASKGFPFRVLGQEENIKLGHAIFFGWTQLNEQASSLLRIPRAKIAADPFVWKKYGFLPRADEVDEGGADRFSEKTPVVGVRVQQGVDGEYRVGYSCAFCHTGRDPANGKIVPGRPSSTLQFGRLIATAENLSEDLRAQALLWPPGTADLSFRYFPDGVENPTAVMQARGIHGMRLWSSAGVPMPEYQRHSNAWLMQGSPYMATLKISVSLCSYLTTLKPIKNPDVDPAMAGFGRKVFEVSRCNTCHDPALGLYTNQRVIPFDATGSNGPPTARMKDSGGIRVTSLMSVYATAPYLHDHSVATLDDLLNPARLVPGSGIYRKPFTDCPAHPFVIHDEQMRRALVEFLKSI
jgi:hypothetical protein